MKKTIMFPIIKISLLMLSASVCMSMYTPVDPPAENDEYLTLEIQEILFTVKNNNELSVTCPVELPENEKNVKYTWTKNGQVLKTGQNDESKLVLKNPTATVEGIYQCVAESSAGIAKSRPISVRRQYIEKPERLVKKHKPIEGRPYQLECPVPSGYPAPKVSWHKRSVSDPKDTNEHIDPRFTLAKDGTLYISSVEMEDVSDKYKYICVTSQQTENGEEEVVIAEHTIDGIEKDSNVNDGELVPQYLSNETTALFGDSIFLYCIHGGRPLDPPDWWKDGVSVNNKYGDRITRHNRSKGKRLLDRYVLFEDEGTFTCKVENGVGKPRTHEIKLHVEGKVGFTDELPRTIKAKEGEDVTIPCSVQGKPVPVLSWTFNAKPLVSTERLSVISTRSDTEAEDELVIRKVQKSDKGYYGCNASNKYGENYLETLLTIE